MTPRSILYVVCAGTSSVTIPAFQHGLAHEALPSTTPLSHER